MYCVHWDHRNGLTFGFAHNRYHLMYFTEVMMVSIWQGRARFNLASSLLGKYGFGGESGLTCASSLNGVERHDVWRG